MTTTDPFRQRQWLGVAVAALLLGTTACGAAGPVAQPTSLASAQPPPSDDLRAAGLSDPSFLTPLGVEGKYADHTVTIIGAYADPARLVMVIRVTPHDALPDLIAVTDDQGAQNASSGGGPAGPSGTGDFIYHIDAGPRPRPDGIAHLTARLQWQLPTGNPASPVPPLVLKFNLPVHRSVSLPPGSPFHLGSWTVTIKTLQVTPATVHVAAMFEGVSSDDELIGPNHLDLITVLDETGKPLGPVSGGGGGNLVEFQWMRPTSAGTYQLRFHGNGATHTVNLNVPASSAI